MDKKITVAIAGLGSRGRTAYAPAAHRFSDRMEIVAVADLDAAKVAATAEEYHIPADRCFSSAEEMLSHERLADALFLCTQDRDHVPQALLALEKGYDILMEKPISPDPKDCRKLSEAAAKAEAELLSAMCFVILRFSLSLKS